MTFAPRKWKWPEMTLTRNDPVSFFRFSRIKSEPRWLLQSDVKTANTYITTYQSLTHYFQTFYGKKLAFCLDFLYLCTGNRKNSLLVPKVGHLWRPRLVLIDGKRRSSMKTTKMGRERLSGELWFKELLNADWAWSTSRTFKTSRKTPALQTNGESYSSPSTLQLSNPISLALSGPKVK